MEQILFRLVSSISSKQLSQALDSPPRVCSNENGDDEGHACRGSVIGAAALDKEAVMEYWAQFPLKTAADVQAWYKNRYESSKPLPVQEHFVQEMDISQDLPTEDSDQQSSNYNNTNTHNNYENNIRRDTSTERLQPPSPSKTRNSHEKTAHTIQDVWGNFPHTSDEQYPPSSSRGTTSSRETTVSPLPVDSGGLAYRDMDLDGRGSSSTGYAGSLSFSQEFQQRFLW